MVPLVSFALGGWMIGWASAPYDPVWAERYPRKEAMMAAAGPAANLLLTALAWLAVRLGYHAGVFHAPESLTFDHITGASVGWAEGLVPLVSVLFSLNLLLFLFNLLPLPPLDGSAIFPILAGESFARRFKGMLRAQPALSLLGLLLAWQLLDPVFHPLYLAALNLLYPGVSYG